MPRRPAEVLSMIPLFLIPSTLKQGIKKAGEEINRIVIKKTSRHYYNISIHTRSINRELKAGVQRVEAYAPREAGS